jgi:hypothetical protein
MAFERNEEKKQRENKQRENERPPTLYIKIPNCNSDQYFTIFTESLKKIKSDIRGLSRGQYIWTSLIIPWHAAQMHRQ